ncbi:MAG TPA: SpoIID/LytB domain-containing protein [Planctomycetota bacterium]|jgi:stage II sporulation protein D
MPRHKKAKTRFPVFLLALVGLVCLISCKNCDRTASSPTVRQPARELTVENPQAHPASTAPLAAATAGEPIIRVAVLKDAPAAHLTVGSAEARVVGPTGQDIEHLPAGFEFDVSVTGRGLAINGSALNEADIRIESTAPAIALRLAGQEVAPTLRVTLTRAGVLNIVAQLRLEEYLCGVLAGEVPFDRWHAEALKAQAITSRSYAYYQMRKNSAEAYDVESTVMSQVFRSGYRNNPILTAAVNSTRGLILTNNGQPFSAYFHSTCGGHTDPSRSVFPDREAARPFAPVTCGFCNQSPAYRWKLILDKRTLEQKLANQFSGAQHLAAVEFIDVNNQPIGPEAGMLRRVGTVVLRKTDGSSSKIVANQFRLAVGAKDLKSMAFEQVVDRGAAIEFSGGGFGHGAGLCQWGSQGMAQAGYTHMQILGRYYAGAGVTRLY